MLIFSILSLKRALSISELIFTVRQSGLGTEK